MELKNGSTLQGGKYKIERVLGQGGFGITYLAIQSGLERKVAIKEFFMKELCERDESTSHVTLGTEGSRETVNRFREKFLKEARNIARLNHPNIVRIIDVFEENGTAYYVMEYAENGSLADKVKREGYLTEPVATRYILQVAEALDYIHQRKMNHLDVKPANIMLNDKDETVLIDFGLSKQYNSVTGSQTSTTPVGISEGYAPMEQYKQGGMQEFSPESDIYALGATFFKLLTGTTPPSASDIYEDGVPVDELKEKNISQCTNDAICKAMQARKKDRFKTVREFIITIYNERQAFSPLSSVLDDNDKNTNTFTNSVKELCDKNNSNYAEEKDETTRIISSNEKQDEVNKHEQKFYAKKKYMTFMIILLSVFLLIFLYKESIQQEDLPNNSHKYSSEKNDSYLKTEDDTIIVNNFDCVLPSGDVVLWSGRMVDGLPTGYGKILYAKDDKDNRESFEGYMDKGKKSGKDGVLKYRSGNIYKGEFKEDCFINGSFYFSNDRVEFIGDFKNNKPFNGSFYNEKRQIYAKLDNGQEIY